MVETTGTSAPQPVQLPLSLDCLLAEPEPQLQALGVEQRSAHTGTVVLVGQAVDCQASEQLVLVLVLVLALAGYPTEAAVLEAVGSGAVERALVAP